MEILQNRAALLLALFLLVPACVSTSPERVLAENKSPAAALNTDTYKVQARGSKKQIEAAKLQNEGVLFLRANNNQAAIDKFRQSIAIYDGFGEVHHCLALALAKEGSIDEATDELQKAIKIKPELSDSWLILAGLCESNGKLQDSLNIYDEFIRRFPQSPLLPKVRVSLGYIYARLGKSEEALGELKEACNKHPELPSSWLTLGGVYQARGELENAIASYREFTSRFPNDSMLERIQSLISSLTAEHERQQREKSETDLIQPETADDTQAANTKSSSPKNNNDDYLQMMLQKNGVGVTRWPKSRIPVSVYVVDGSRTPGYRDSFKTILVKSFESWAKASEGNLSFNLVGSATEARLICSWTSDRSKLGSSSEAGNARVFEDQSYISRAEICFLTQEQSKAITDNMFRTIALHEIGHALGLSGHTNNPEDIMFYSNTLKDSWRELSGRDCRSIKRLYQSDL